MSNFRIVFYEPKSTGASILGVLLKMILLILPIGIISIFLAQEEDPQWLWLAAGGVAGMLLMIKSEIIIYPLVGLRHEFDFDNDAVTIRRAGQEERVLIKDLSSLTAFEVEAESGTVKHIVLEFAGGRKTDIFETWVTGASTKDFDGLYRSLKKD